MNSDLSEILNCCFVVVSGLGVFSSAPWRNAMWGQGASTEGRRGQRVCVTGE